MIDALIANVPQGPWGLSPIIFQTGDMHIGSFHIGHFALRWYSMAYLIGIILGFLYLLKLIEQPGAPMAKRHAEDMVFYATLGIILGGRLAYALFYEQSLLTHPGELVKLWRGGMSFHGGVIGVTLGIFYLAWRNKLSALRIHDYVACCVPPGLLLGRIANFINGELWGATTDLPWGVVFPSQDYVPRHPSQLYEAFLEGIVLFAVLWYMFWKTKARYEPGKLVGTFALGYGMARFLVEFIRMPDQQLKDFTQMTGLHMGQWLSLPMIFGGLYLVLTAKKRRERVEPIAGSESIA